MEKVKKTRDELEASSKEYREALQHDVTDIIEQSRNILAGVAIAGLSFWVIYKLYKSLVKEDKEERDSGSNNQSIFNPIRDILIKEIAMLLLGIVKDKVVEYIQNLEENDTEDH